MDIEKWWVCSLLCSPHSRSIFEVFLHSSPCRCCYGFLPVYCFQPMWLLSHLYFISFAASHYTFCETSGLSQYSPMFPWTVLYFHHQRTGKQLLSNRAPFIYFGSTCSLHQGIMPPSSTGRSSPVSGSTEIRYCIEEELPPCPLPPIFA